MFYLNVFHSAKAFLPAMHQKASGIENEVDQVCSPRLTTPCQATSSKLLYFCVYYSTQFMSVCVTEVVHVRLTGS